VSETVPIAPSALPPEIEAKAQEYIDGINVNPSLGQMLMNHWRAWKRGNLVTLGSVEERMFKSYSEGVNTGVKVGVTAILLTQAEQERQEESGEKESAQRSLEGKRITIEDVFRDGELFGFRVRWAVQDHWADVTVWEIAGQRAEDGTPLFTRKDSQSQPDPVESTDEAEEYLDGHVKWDGCSEFNQGRPHWCGPAGYKYHIALLEYLYKRAFELMGSLAEECWDEHEAPQANIVVPEGGPDATEPA
jgi:hypothetical protein